MDRTNIYYKRKYKYYKAKYMKMILVVESLRKLLDQNVPEPQSPSDSPASSPTLVPPPVQLTHDVSPILGSLAKQRQSLSCKIPSDNSEDESVDIENGSNKWECLPLESPKSVAGPSSAAVPPLQFTHEISPIFGSYAKRRLSFPSNNFVEDSEDDDFVEIENGSNKWECLPLESPSPETKASVSSPLQQLKQFPKYSGLETRTQVSTKIRGADRRALPGQTCDKCESYYREAGLTHLLNQVSRHRCTDKSVTSTKGCSPQF